MAFNVQSSYSVPMSFPGWILQLWLFKTGQLKEACVKGSGDLSVLFLQLFDSTQSFQHKKLKKHKSTKSENSKLT